MRVAIVVLALMGPIVAAGCTAPGGSGPSDGGADRDVTMTLVLDRTSIRVGDKLGITATVENRGDSSFDYRHRGCPPELIDVTAVTPDGREIRLYEYGVEGFASACALRDASIPPGERYTAKANWNGRTEQAPDNEPHTGPAVARGTYTIVARLATIDGSAPYEVTAAKNVTVS